MLRTLSLLVILIVCPASAIAYNSAYEESIATQLAEGQPAEEVVWLRAGGREYISLYRKYSTDQPRGAVIVLHGMGGHPDWPELVSPLRRILPDFGWATLSLQMPVMSPAEPIADYGKTIDDAKQRIHAAVQQLREWRFSNIAIIGHSFGAATAAYALSANDMNAVKAFVGISMQAQQFLNPKLKLLKQLESVSIPVLDIYGSRDMLEVRREEDDRRLAAQKNGNSEYRQMEIEGADHYFTGLSEVLGKRIHGWLAKVMTDPELHAEDGRIKDEEAKLEAKTGE